MGVQYVRLIHPTHLEEDVKETSAEKSTPAVKTDTSRRGSGTSPSETSKSTTTSETGEKLER